MAEVGASVAAKLAEYLVHPTLQQLQYMFYVSKITGNVEIKKRKLILKQGKVQECVQEAINRTERIDGEVTKWKNDVNSLIAEVEKLEEELRANNGCLQGWCPTWRRYCLCKMLAKTTQRMIDLDIKSDHFNPFSHPVTISDIDYHSSQNFKLFNSTQKAFDQLWEALQDDGNSMIGLWGMGGSGKTTLVKEVGKKAKKSQLFDRVVLTTFSQSLDIRKIQGEIADTLGLELKEETEIGRAKRIALRLQSGERILIILDDIWAMLNLEDIGIPIERNHQRSCKVILTTRRLDVCTLMECQNKIQLHLLKEDEAWTLFQTHANVDEAAKECVARAIARECKGLPIAIVAVGSCLKGKGIDEMNIVLCRLRNAKPNNIDKGVRDAFACLELSYDFLATLEAQRLLLICAMFPEDHDIVVEDLFRYGVGLGLCKDADSFQTGRSQVRAAINDLIDSSLLMHSSLKFNVHAPTHVKLHDMVRDVALWIASKKDGNIMHLAQRATKIVFYELEGGSKSFIPDIVQAVGGMKELSRLCLQRCSKIECIIDETTLHEDAVVLKLNELVLRDMDNLERLCRAPSPFSLFEKLERLTIFNCPQLLHIFPVDCSLGNLKVLNVNKCPMLTSLFPVSAVCTLLSLEELRIKCCNELKHLLDEDGGVDAWLRDLYNCKIYR
ncbi:probable disease resistance protein At4g27220 [Neltuma alba]|uniref:probable disease resistance protein At4g27220 n=1 Tax=Neltuma alba TaxID=207710 RepID=UPI0010A54BF7|nr:probable disease resistance protein At4g27220 [Prosopis alba]